MLSLAAISWSARIRLASLLTSVSRIASSSVWEYVLPPRVREVTGQAPVWFFQKPWPRGHRLPGFAAGVMAIPSGQSVVVTVVVTVLVAVAMTETLRTPLLLT